MPATAEDKRLSPETRKDWLRWGPYLSERQWGTVREDYSEGGTAWDFFPHDHARARAYRWGEDGIAGISDEEQRLCFSLALWNGNDPILKERMFGLTNDQGNHGEDVKEVYFYQDSAPSHAWMKMLYKYPQAAYPYQNLLEENGRRKGEPGAMEYELLDTGVFAEDRYFDVEVAYAKRGPDDILVRITATNRGPEAHRLVMLPTLWFRNTWSWKSGSEKPSLRAVRGDVVLAEHPEMAAMSLVCPGADALLFCENETNSARLFGGDGPAFPKDGINDHVLHGAASVNPAQTGTKAAALFDREIAAGASETIVLRLCKGEEKSLGATPDKVFAERLAETDAFYATRLPEDTSADRKAIYRQASAGLLWSKQFFHYVVADWLDGDDMPPPEGRKGGRNAGWRHFYAKDIISMPDTWEYPWFASWDLSFHTVALARLDLQFAKDQVLLLCREWYMSPHGQAPAYEWAFDDVNPPVQAWAALKIMEYERATFGTVDTDFLHNVFDHGLLYFAWWVNRKDAEGNNLFQGGFLGLDNISAFDRSSGYLPGGGRIYQSDGTTWVGFFALQMMEIALELSRSDPHYLQFAAKFFQHFAYIADAIDHLTRESDGSVSLLDPEEGLYFDVLKIRGDYLPLKIRSQVSLLPMIAAMDLDFAELEAGEMGHFRERLEWFRDEQAALLDRVTGGRGQHKGDLMLSFLDREGLVRLLRPMLDEAEFLSAFGLRSVSKRHEAEPFHMEIDGQSYDLEYQPAESRSGMFGGNSNWRGPIWMPTNYILVDALRTYHAHYGDDLKVEYPTGSGHMATLAEVADGISARLISIFEVTEEGRRPVFGGAEKFATDPGWRDNVLFYEYFHGDNGAGIGAAHQTGWTGLVAVLIEEQERRRTAALATVAESVRSVRKTATGGKAKAAKPKTAAKSKSRTPATQTS
jgi:hypothetical protein